MNESLMKIPLLLVFLIYFSECVTVTVNTTSTYAFKDRVIKAESLYINNEEFLLILFKNGSITKLNNKLQFLQLIKFNDTTKIADFSIINNNSSNYSTPSIVALANSFNQWRMISLLNPSFQMKYNTTANISQVIGLSSYIPNSTYYSSTVLVSASDVVQQYSVSQNVTTLDVKYNFTNSVTRDYIYAVKEIKANNVFTKSLLVLTQGKKLYSFDPVAKTATLQYTITSVSALSSFALDSQTVALPQCLDRTIPGYNLTSRSSVSPDATLLAQIVLNSSVLQDVRPRFSQSSQRYLMFQSKIIKVNLTSPSIYSLISVTQSFSYADNSILGYVYMKSSKIGFMYKSDDAKVYSYCQSTDQLTNDCSNNIIPCTVEFTGCQLCDTGYTKCTKCQNNHLLSKNQCEKLQCNITNCYSCASNTTCGACDSGYELNIANTTCTLIVPNTTIPIVNNTMPDPQPSNATTQNTTIVDNATVIDNATVVDNTTVPIVDNSSIPAIDNGTVVDNTTIDNTTIIIDYVPSPLSPVIINPTPENNTIPLNDTSPQNNTIPSNDTNPPSPIKNQTITPQPTPQPIPEPTPLPSRSFSKQAINQIYQSYTPQVKDLATSSSMINSSPLYRLIFTFLTPVFGLFDDYWFYVYHDNPYQSLKVMPGILVFLYMVNKERILPDYLRFSDHLSLTVFKHSDYYGNYTNHRILTVDEEITYLEQNIEELVLQQFSLLLIFFLFLKFIVCLLKKCCHPHHHSNKQQLELSTLSPKSQQSHAQTRSRPSKSLFQTFVQYLEDSCSLKSILLCLIGSNLIFLTFKVSCQLRVFFAFKFIDKVNLILTLNFGFVFVILFITLITLAQVFLPTVKISKKDTKQVIKSKKQQKSYIFTQDLNMAIFNCSKGIFYGFIHGFFIANNVLQYILLIFVKIILLFIIKRHSQLFKQKAFATLTCIYYMMGILIDILCLFSKLNIFPEFFLNEISTDFNVVSIFQIAFTSFLFFSVILVVVFRLYYDIKYSFCPEKEDEASRIFHPKAKSLFAIFRRIVPIDQFVNEDNQEESLGDSMKDLPKHWLNQKVNLKSILNKKLQIKTVKSNQSFYQKRQPIKVSQLYKKKIDIRNSVQNPNLQMKSSPHEEQSQKYQEQQIIKFQEQPETTNNYSKARMKKVLMHGTLVTPVAPSTVVKSLFPSNFIPKTRKLHSNFKVKQNPTQPDVLLIQTHTSRQEDTELGTEFLTNLFKFKKTVTSRAKHKTRASQEDEPIVKGNRTAIGRAKII